MKKILLILPGLLLLLSQTSHAQSYSACLTDQEVVDFLKWETGEMLNFHSSLFDIPARIRMLTKSNEWKAYISYHKDSLQYLDTFAETFKPVELEKFVAKEDIDFLRKQFTERKTNVEFKINLDEVDLVKTLPKDKLTVIYSVPLVTKDKNFFFLLKEYKRGRDHGESVVQVYKKVKDGEWSLWKAGPVADY